MSDVDRMDVPEHNEIEAVRQAMWNATGSPPDTVEVANFRARLKEQGWSVRPSTDSGAVDPDLLAAGDTMQSALSRIEAWMREPMPYEVAMARLEGARAVEAWTEARRRTPRGAV